MRLAPPLTLLLAAAVALAAPSAVAAEVYPGCLNASAVNGRATGLAPVPLTDVALDAGQLAAGRLSMIQRERYAAFLLDEALVTPEEAVAIASTPVPAAASVPLAIGTPSSMAADGAATDAMVSVSGNLISVTGAWTYIERRTHCNDGLGSRHRCTEVGGPKPLTDARVWLWYWPSGGHAEVIAWGATNFRGNYELVATLPTPPRPGDRVRVQIELRSVVWRNPLFTIYPHAPTNRPGSAQVATADTEYAYLRNGTWNFGDRFIDHRAANAYATAQMFYEEWFQSTVIRDEFFDLNIFAGEDRSYACSNGTARLAYFDSTPGLAYGPFVDATCPTDPACDSICDRAVGHVLAHEIGHYAYYLAAEGDVDVTAEDYEFTFDCRGVSPCPAVAGWSMDTPEWQTAAYFEGLATFFGTVTFFAPDAESPSFESFSTVSHRFNCAEDLGSPPSRPARTPGNVARFLWELYDTRDQGNVWFEDDIAMPEDWFTAVFRAFPPGTGNHRRLENNAPFSPGSAYDLDGPNIQDFKYWAERTGIAPLWDQIYSPCLAESDAN